mmetsp:Transcript_34472/g.77240  ORF Transcript_34472/g.77240 Transcript_34472/m.77240 type:complete len:190 (+) Transcript_34472:94-663(+)
MSVNLGTGADPNAGQMVAAGGGAMGDRFKGAIENLPGFLQGIPGNPEVSGRTGIVAGVLMFLASNPILGFFVFKMELSFSALVMSMQMTILSLIGIVLEGSQELPQVTKLSEIREGIVSQVRLLSSHYGLAVLHGVQMLYAFGIGGWILCIACFVSFVAFVLDIICWQVRRGMLMDGGHSGLIDEQERM